VPGAPSDAVAVAPANAGADPTSAKVVNTKETGAGTGLSGVAVQPPVFRFGLGGPEVWIDPEGEEDARVGFVRHYIEHVAQTLGITSCFPPRPVCT
jgi:hypothetical protein